MTAAPTAVTKTAVGAAGYTVVRARRVTVPLHRRAVAVTAGLVVLLAAACLAYFSASEALVAPGEVLKVLTGRPSPDELVVGTLRAPRLVVGLLVDAAFGVAGGLVQTVARKIWLLVRSRAVRSDVGA